MALRIVLLLLFTALALAQNNMHQRMDDLVDSVKSAVHDAEEAGKKREVIDLGQSLHLLETKFAGLRSALEQELGSKSSKFTSHNVVAKELMDRSSELVQGVVTQREELRKLSSDVKEVDSAIRAIKEGMVNFEQDVAELSRILSDLHISHNELTAAHEETKSSVHEVLADGHESRKSTSHHGMLYLLLLVELSVFVGYLYIKRPASSLAHKAYGKFG